MASKRNGTIYVGVTSSIQHRSFQHRTGMTKGFTKRYGVNKLVYFEFLESMPDAIRRENRIKSWSRRRKLELIEVSNPDWDDLFMQLF
jgi:putative endonuclease